MAIYQGDKKIAENIEIIQGAKINDDTTGEDSTWSSKKINEQLKTVDAYTKAESDARYPLKKDIPTKLPADGGNSATVNGHTVLADVPANAKFTDTVQDLSSYAKKTDIPTSLPANGGTAAQVTSLRHETAYSDIFSTTLASTHGCWNKWCFVMGSSNNASSTDYIANAPEAISAIWYEVFTGGRTNRAFQIAIGCYKHQRNMFIRYQHDNVWSGWNKISPADADSLYVIGAVAIPTGGSGTSYTVSVGFTPRFVLVQDTDTGYNPGVTVSTTTNGFTISGYNSVTSSRSFRYMAFR